MNQSEFVTKLALKAGITKQDAENTLKTAGNIIMESLRKKEKVFFPGFGTFSIKTRGARTGHNPRTGETIMIPERNVPCFSPGSKLKTSVTEQKKGGK